MKALSQASPEVLADLLDEQKRMQRSASYQRVRDLIEAYAEARTIAMNALILRRGGEGWPVDATPCPVDPVHICMAVQRHFVEEIMLAVRQ